MRYIFIITMLLLCLIVNGCTLLNLPPNENLESLHLKSATQVFDSNGQLISKLFEENRIVVPISQITPNIQKAIIANEDIRFYSHLGIDPIGITRAIWVNIRTGSLTEGGSTLTQQLAKNMFLTQERTLGRKAKEALLALTLERKFSKQEILQAYLNQVYFGEGAYGVEAAAQVYFSKHASELTLAESAMLAGLPRGPSLYSPYVDSKAALARRAVVLEGMLKAGYINAGEAEKANKEPITLSGKKKRSIQASYFLDYIAQQLVGKYGANQVYKGGLKIHTTLDIKTQQAAESLLGKYQGGIIALDPRTGYIKAMVGGRNYEESQVNRTITEIRQPGSAFKPFVYTEAFNQGLLESDILVDEPINISGYAPRNYDKKYRGSVTLKKALRLSLNTCAVKLGQHVGMDRVITLAQNMGISTLTPLDNNLATALGGLTQGVSLFELSAAYTAFANSGIVSHPVSIIKVIDENGNVLEENRSAQRSVLRPDIAYLMTDMMKSVIENGTGATAALGRPSAGKTGTTDNYETAWFIGYTPELLVGIYIGNDDRTPVGISGSEVAGFWGEMMKKALAGTPVSNFAIPQNIVANIAICTNTGKPPGLLCQEAEYDAFIKGTEPIAPPLKIPENTNDQYKPQTSDKPFWQQLLPRLPKF